MARTRNEKNHRNTHSKDGSFSPHISTKVAQRIDRYCRATNQNKTKFVEMCCTSKLDVLETEFLASLSKEAVIKLYLDELSKR